MLIGAGNVLATAIVYKKRFIKRNTQVNFIYKNKTVNENDTIRDSVNVRSLELIPCKILTKNIF